MAHHGHPRLAIQKRPPNCPKCGSHRTEIVGRSSDATTVNIRCNACEERSQVTVTDRASRGQNDSPRKEAS
jgi:transcription elongation factor Elf1